MYDIIKNVITSGSYELTDILKKIDTIWLQGTLTEEQRTELIDLAPPVQTQKTVMRHSRSRLTLCMPI